MIMGCTFICGIVPCCCFAMDEPAVQAIIGVPVEMHDHGAAKEAAAAAQPPGAVFMQNGVWMDKDSKPLPIVPETQI